MLTRIISAVVGIILLGYIINTGGWIFYLGISFLNIYAIYELCNAFKKINIRTNFLLSSFFSVVLLYFVNFFYEFDFIVVYFFIILMLMLVFLNSIIDNNRTNLNDAVFSIFSFIYPSLLFICVVLVRNLSNGINITWWIFIITWACDTGAFFIGIIFGKKPLAPNISPKKTLEGSLGGVLSSVVASVVFATYLLPEIETIHAIMLGILVGFVCQVGDLSASLIKRYCKIKDYSNIIPGHGGILDRLDSALFSFPMAYIYLKILL